MRILLSTDTYVNSDNNCDGNNLSFYFIKSDHEQSLIYSVCTSPVPWEVRAEHARTCTYFRYVPRVAPATKQCQTVKKRTKQRQRQTFSVTVLMFGFRVQQAGQWR